MNHPPATATVTVLTVSTAVAIAVETAVATVEAMGVVMGGVVLVQRLTVRDDDQPFSLISKDRWMSE